MSQIVIGTSSEPAMVSDSPARTAGTKALHYPTRIRGRLAVLTFLLTSR
jgi:hypothetical protein